MNVNLDSKFGPGNKDKDDFKATLFSPYGPQYYGTDEAEDGADSSPHEAEPTGERKAATDAACQEG